jgi:peptide/nickel transport system permease protein
VVQYLWRRLLAAVLLVVVVSSAALLLTRLAPGDFASDLFGVGTSAEQLARERARYGLDQPLLRQYLAWISEAVQFDFGTSLLYRRPVGGLVRERAGHTAILAVNALLVATLLGVPAGVVTGSRRRGVVPAAVKGASLLLISLPSLVLSLVLVMVGARTGWFPTGGMQTAGAWEAGVAAGLADLARHLALPTLALALPLAATIERVQSQAMRQALATTFALSTRARGVPEGRLVWRDALRPSLGPLASTYGFILGSLLSGSFVVEVVTSWPGLGRLMYDALRARDLYLVAGCAAAGSLFLAAGTLASDLFQAWADPRLREGRGAAAAEVQG